MLKHKDRARAGGGDRAEEREQGNSSKRSKVSKPQKLRSYLYKSDNLPQIYAIVNPKNKDKVNNR